MSTRFVPLAPLALAAAIGITFLQTAAFAGPVSAETHRTVEVSVKDLNLANPADVTKLDGRIARAAKTACEPADWRNLTEVAARPACEASAIASATPKKQQLVARAQSEQVASRSSITVHTD